MRDAPPSSRRSPSLHETHDAPGAPAQWELDLVLGRIAILEEELSVQRRRLDTLRQSSRPPDVEITTTKGRLRGRGAYVVVVAITMVVLSLIWRGPQLWEAFHK